MQLIEELKAHLPIPAFPLKGLQKILRKKPLFKKNAALEIVDVFDSGDMGGIVCVISNDDKTELLVVSLTHLKIMPDHPLSDKILAYQKQRIKSLSQQR